MKRSIQRYLFIWPLACLIVAAFLLPITVPEIGDVQTFVHGGLAGIPIFIWSLIGLAPGAVLSYVRSRWPKQTLRYGARVLMALGSWLLFGLVLAAMTGEGSYFERMRGSVVLETWAVLVWALLCMAPTMVGVHSVMYRSSMSRGATMLAFLFLALSGMIYAQAADVEVAHQDPFLSTGFILAVIGFLEGINWRNRYRTLDYEERMGGLLLWRQVGFTLIFMGVGALAGLIPFLVGDWPGRYYESTTIMGKAFIGSIALFPLVVFAAVRNLFDRRGPGHHSSNRFK